MSDNPPALLNIRSFGTEAGVLIIFLMQFSSKISYLYFNEIRTTITGSLSSQGSTSAQKSLQARKAAARGRFQVTPNVLSYRPIEITTISEPDRFFEDPELQPSVRISTKK